MARAWIELPAGSRWGDTRVAIGQLEDQGYATAELRGTGPVLLRLSGSALERGELQPVCMCPCGHHRSIHAGPRSACGLCRCAGYAGPVIGPPDWVGLRYITRRSGRTGAAAAEPESYYRDMLARQVGGKTEVTLPFGRADVMTDTMVWEVEPAARWRDGVTQSLQYAAQVPQRGALALYGNGVKLATVRAGLASLPSPGLELWWLAGDLFVRIKEIKPQRAA